MLRICTPALCCAACLLMIAPASGAEAPPASETLLPQSTQGFISIADVRLLADQWDKTQLGQLMQDPVMEPFAKDLRRQLENRWSGVGGKLGLTLDDLKDVPGGEVCLAVTQPGPEKMAVVILVDVTDHQEEAEALLEEVAKNLAKKQAKKTTDTVAGTPVVQFVLPKKQGEESPRQAIYFLKDNLLGAADNLEVLKGILQQRSAAEGKTLADLDAFKEVMARCQKDLGEGKTPQVRWFMQPLGYAEVVRAATPERQRRKGKTMLDVLKNQGFGGLKGIGGFVDLAVDRFELLHRTAIYAPKPYEKSMKMAVFPNADEFAPQAWVPRDVATYSTGYCDFLNTFDNFGSLFDEVVGEGEEGVWLDVLDGFKNDPNGPQIDVRKELVAHLSNRLTIITDYKLPITTSSERLLFGLETKNEKAVAAALKKLLEKDRDVRKRVFQGHVIWEYVRKAKPTVPTISLDAPPLGPPVEEEEPEQEEEQAPLLPNAAVTAARGHLLIASHLDFLTKVLGEIDPRDTLGRSIDYMIVNATIKELDGGENSARVFSRTDEECRPTYELIRQGKMPESETMLGRVLNTLFGVDTKGAARKQKIDGTKLPDFEYVRRHLGPAGMSVTSEANGWFLKGFALPKESQ